MKCRSQDCIGLQELLPGQGVTASAFHYPSRKCVVIVVVVLRLVLSIEQHDESGGRGLPSWSGTMGAHLLMYSSTYRADK